MHIWQTEMPQNAAFNMGLHCLLKHTSSIEIHYTVKPVLSSHSKRRPKISFQDQLSLNAGQKYCRILRGEHSAILSTCIKLLLLLRSLCCLFLSGR